MKQLVNSCRESNNFKRINRMYNAMLVFYSYYKISKLIELV